MSRNQLKGSEVRAYALGLLVAGLASLVLSAGTVIGLAIGLACVSFLFEG